MRILVGVDGSSNSLATVAYAGRLLARDRDEFILCYVAPEVPAEVDEHLDAGVAARARSALSSAVFDEAVSRLAPEWRTRIELVETSGPAGAKVLEVAKDRTVDLIAVGFRGAGLFERFMLGSVSRAIVQSATVPVLVVKSDPGEQAALNDPLRVLVTYDGAVMGQRIALVAKHISWPEDATGWVLSVVPPMFIAELPDWLKPITRDDDVRAMAEAWEREHDQQVAEAVGELRSFQQTLPKSFHQFEPIVAEGRPGEKIMASIRKLRIGLVIVGSRGRGGVSKLLIGSTSAEIIHGAPCSVLVVR
jgi:nucleotide-binding universal stress UspA family protein